MPSAALLMSLLCSAIPPDSPQINPVPRATRSQTLVQWDFEQDAEGWTAERQCTVAAQDGLLRITSTGEDPYMHRPVKLPGGEVSVEFRARTASGDSGAVYWTTDQSPGRGEDKSRHFSLQSDGQWHEYSVRFAAPGTLADLRLDPGSAPGEAAIDWIRVVRHEPHPLSIEMVDTSGPSVRFTVKNHAAEPIDFSALGKTHTLEAEAAIELKQPTGRGEPLEAVRLELETEGWPAVRRTVFVAHPEAQADWIVRPLGDFSLEVARSGLVARVRREGQVVAMLAPTVHCDGKLPALRLVDEGPALRFRGDGVELRLAAQGSELSVAIAGPDSCEGPVVRAMGGLEQGLFAGLEYLGKGERSSSTLDVETPEHLRFAPDPLKVTLPLMAFVTERVSVAMTWADMGLQPLYATPNFFDGADDHRMALRGPKIEATIRFDRLPAEEAIWWAVTKAGLPPLPQPPRSPAEQRQMCVKALNGPLRNEAGWGHCLEPNWGRQPYADMASTLWRLTGQVPELPRLVPGGAHVRNEAIYFVTGRAAEWLRIHQEQVRGLMAQQQPDGSFRYDGKFARGHFENTASGVCARPAALLLEYAWMTGDRESRQSGLKTLEFMKRFRTPRGAQVWEIPLHTPDQLASAYCVWAYVRGYELTGEREYLKHARKWALSGIPFVYLWSRYPIMLYSTPPVFGATNWVAPCWIGLPVQWVGGVYAYALTLLAPHDDSLDWNHLARGILLSGEQQQYPEGEKLGLLPDSFAIPQQQRRGPNINPCGLMSLRLKLDGELDSLSVASDGKHRVVAPFPVTLREGQAHVEARPGVAYQVLIDGQRIVEVRSKGHGVVAIE